MKRCQGLALILGLGRFGGGLQAAKFLHRRGWHLRIADQACAADLAASVAALTSLSDLEWALGREDTDLLNGVGLLIVNPAVPDEHPLLLAARERGIMLSQEVNLFLEHYPGRVVLVSGTNGKSTTATLIHAALTRGGNDALLGGNIGRSLLADEADWSDQQIAVLEISSFQLERIDPDLHRVTGCVLTKITEDHLDRHGNLERYRAAKARAAAAAQDFLVHHADDEIAGRLASPAKKRLRYTGAAMGKGIDHGWQDGWLHTGSATGERALLHCEALRLLGSFHRENVAAAAAAAAELQVDRHPTGLALCLTRPLQYRLQEICQHQGVRIFDNSISTELHSTLSAVRSLPAPIHWVGGGKSKDGNYRRVAKALAPLISSAHLYGTAATPLAAEFSAQTETTTHQSLEDALTKARQRAPRGSTILFSPGFASFDQFKNCRERSEAFHHWLKSSLTDN